MALDPSAQEGHLQRTPCAQATGLSVGICPQSLSSPFLVPPSIFETGTTFQTTFSSDRLKLQVRNSAGSQSRGENGN